MRDEHKTKEQFISELVELRPRDAELKAADTERVRAKESIPERKIWSHVAGMFVLLFILVWLDEVMDLPHLLLGAPDTPINWREAITETVLIASVGLYVVLRLIRDINEWVRAKEVLRESEQWLSTTLRSIGDAVIATDAKGLVTLMNPVAKDLTGWDEAETVGKPLEDVFNIINEQTGERAENPVARVLREGVVVGLANHTVLIAKDGTKRPIADSGAPIRDEEGSIIGTVMVFRDITERKQAERAVQEAREYAENIVETVREPLVVLDADLRVVSANRSFYQTFEVTPGETEGQLFYSLDNRQWDIPRLRELLEEILSENIVFDDFEVEHDFETVGRRTMILNARRIYREANKTQLILLAVEDVTERKRAEEALRESEAHYRSLFANMAEGVCLHEVICDDAGEAVDYRITDVNPKYETILGVTRKQAVGSLGSKLYGADEPPYLDIYTKVAETGVPTYFETYFPPMDRHFAISVFSPDKGRFATVFSDITERKRAEEALKEYSERLEEMVEERTQELREAQEELLRKERLAILGQLAGGVGHELRNPLGALKNAAYFLNMVIEEPEPEVKETLEILEKEVGTSERIISSLLDFARAKAPVRRKVDVNDIVQEALSRATVPEKVEVISQLDKTLPAILADPDQLGQVFGNIILNDIQAMPEGGRLVVQTSGVSEKPPRSGWVAVSFADTGVGIPEENLGKLFEPLFTTKAKGIGLGLAVTRTLVEGHGGTIEVQSEVGKGSTFTVKLPIGRGPALSPSASLRIESAEGREK
jgi:PAS domain S-box-containing protein